MLIYNFSAQGGPASGWQFLMGQFLKIDPYFFGMV
jgi:hypothetical protein